MKALIVSKALIAATYRQKLTEMARCNIEVHAVVPPGWREGGSWHPLEGGSDGSYQLTVAPVRLNGHFHLHYYPSLARIVGAQRPDIVHLDEEPYNLATYLGLRAAPGIPSLFFTWQNIGRRYPPPFGTLERRVYAASAAAIAGNAEAKTILRDKGYKKAVAVIPQFGVDPLSFVPRPRQHQGFVIGFLNRLVPAKGPFLALDALAALPGDTRLRFVGDGPVRTEIAAEIERRGLEKRAVVEPRVPSATMPDVLNELDVVLLPSLTTPSWKEQFGRVLVEAMACGVPVIGSNSGEIPNVIGDAGMVVPEGDTRALSAALQQLYDDGALRRKLAESGRQRVLERYTHARIAAATGELYRSLTSQT